MCCIGSSSCINCWIQTRNCGQQTKPNRAGLYKKHTKNLTAAKYFTLNKLRACVASNTPTLVKQAYAFVRRGLLTRLLGASPPSSEARCYLATELATMGDLFVLLKKRRTLSERQARGVILQLVMAVAGLHRNSICHRDIKPENVLLERSQLNPRGVNVMVSFPCTVWLISYASLQFQWRFSPC